jgi:CheY-specific phosphatase CheX
MSATSVMNVTVGISEMGISVDPLETLITYSLGSGVALGSLYEGANGIEGLAVLRQEKVDLVFADINMPLMGGMEMVALMKGDDGLVLAVPEALARTIAANFLGMDEDDPIVEEHGSDSLGEILNVICGHLLTALYGRDGVFDLSIPRPFTLTGEEAAILVRKKGFYAFSIDEHQVLLQASFCNPVPGETPNAYG